MASHRLIVIYFVFLYEVSLKFFITLDSMSAALHSVLCRGVEGSCGHYSEKVVKDIECASSDCSNYAFLPGQSQCQISPLFRRGSISGFKACQ